MALRVDDADVEAERRAVRAFCDARAAGAHEAARTRRRDDWRPRGLRGGRSLRTTLAVLLAGFTLGGAAFAAIGGAGSVSRGAGDGPRPAATSPDARPGGRGPGSAAPPPGTSAAGRDTARDTALQCRAYERAERHGKSLVDTALRRLADAAGGEDRIDGYCERALRRAGDGEQDEREGSAGDTAEAPLVPDPPAVPAVPDVTVPVPTGAPAAPTAAPPDPPTVPDPDRDSAGDAAGDDVTGTLPDVGQDQNRLDVDAEITEPDQARTGSGTGTRE